MATVLPHRRPLGTRSLQNPSQLPTTMSNRVASGSKRPRSPEHGETHARPSPKRVRATTLGNAPPGGTALPHRKNKDIKIAKREERQEKADEFKRKYKKAFPGWIFYLDSESLSHQSVQTFKTQILHLGGKIEVFFSSSITHLIVARHPTNTKPEKENVNIKQSEALRSPIKLTGRAGEDTTYSIIDKAEQLGKKVWSAAKLDSVLARVIEPWLPLPTTNARFATTSAAPKRSLTRLLQTEKIHGTTERDPREKRHDYRYFTKGSCFVLLEDMRGHLATLAAHEYSTKDKGKTTKPWPVLHCHPLAKNPFIPFDEVERKRYERQQAAEKSEDERTRQKKHKLLLDAFKRKVVEPKQIELKRGGNNLRKAASVNNIRRRFSHPIAGPHGGQCIDLDDDGDDIESTNASGYGASGAGAYVAASGNIVGITSTTGTTSTSMQAIGNIPHIPLDRLGRHVVTSLKYSAKVKTESMETNANMGPPSKLPTKQHLLRKSKSTNTLKLPKREEGVKPGYCESCRDKFSDFTRHVVSTKHHKFAINGANFAALDSVLDRLQRRTQDEVCRAEASRIGQWRDECRRNPHMIRMDKAQEIPYP